MAEYKTFKPQKNAFIIGSFVFAFIFRLIVHIIILTGFFLGLGRAAGVLALAILFITFIALTVFHYYRLSVSYNKREYQFYHNRIIVKGGGIFSDFQNELVLKNVTHVSLKVPYIWNKIFGIGHISIDAAGSSGVFLSDLDSSPQMYAYIEKLLSKNGFSLQKKKLLQEEQPNKIAVVIEIIKAYIAVIAFIIFAGISSIIPLIIAIITNPMLAIIASVVILFVILIAITFSIFTFLDLSRRTYRVYSDTITYEEGFLSKTYSFVPLENVSDSSLTQSFIDKLLNLYDVKVSCQGSGKEILFKNMNRGEELEENIDSAIKAHKKLADTKPTTKKATASKKAEKQVASKPVFDSTFTDEFTMSMKRSMFIFYFLVPLSLLGGPLFFFALFAAVFQFLRVKKSVFKVKENSIESTYSFLTKNKTEFSLDKITSVEYKISLLDRLFDTMSLTFYSIGSASNITFANVKREFVDENKMLQKVGMTKAKEIHRLKPDFTFLSFLAINFVGIIIFIGLLSASVFAAAEYSAYFYLATFGLFILFIIQLIYLFLRYKNMSLSFYSGYLCFAKGILNKTRLYALYDNIKDNQTSHIFFIQKGKVTCNIAGDKIVGSGKNQTTISNSFTLPYVNNITKMDDLFDFIFLSNPSVKDIADFLDSDEELSKPIHTAKASAKNGILLLCIISVIIFPLLLILPLTISLVALSQSKKSFVLEDERVLYKKGVLFKSQQSVLYKKIDSIDNDQGMFNKLFDNGNITVNTAGSSAPEMDLRSVINFREFYDRLKENYK